MLTAQYPPYPLTSTGMTSVDMSFPPCKDLVLADAHLDPDSGHNLPATLPHCGSAATCRTMRPNIAVSGGGTSFACAPCATCTKILAIRQNASRASFAGLGLGLIKSQK